MRSATWPPSCLEESRRPPKPFPEWLDTVRDPAELELTLRSKGWANRLIDRAPGRE